MISRTLLCKVWCGFYSWSYVSMWVCHFSILFHCFHPLDRPPLAKSSIDKRVQQPVNILDPIIQTTTLLYVRNQKPPRSRHNKHHRRPRRRHPSHPHHLASPAPDPATNHHHLALRRGHPRHGS